MVPTPVSRWAAIGLGVALAFFAVTAAVSYRNQRQFAETEDLAASSRLLISEVSELVSLLQAAETAQRAYLATERGSFHKAYDDTAAKVLKKLVEVRRIAARGGRQAAVDDLLSAVSARLDNLGETLRLGEKDIAAGRTALGTGRGQGLMEEVRRQATAFRQSEEAVFGRRNGEAARALRFTHTSDLLTAAIGLVLAATAFFRLKREFLARDATARALDEQRELLQVTLHSLGEAVVTADDTGRVLSLNAAAERLIGRPPEELRGLPLAEVLPLIDARTRDEVEGAATQALRTGQPSRQATQSILVAKDGTERRIEGCAAPIRTADGRLLGVVLTFRDVTERHRAEESSRRGGERLRRALRAARAIAWEADLRADVMVRSENATDLLGLAPFGSIAEHFQSIDTADRERVVAAFDRATRGEAKDYQAEYRVALPDGRTVWVADRGEPRGDEESTPTHLVGVSIDITVRKQAEEALREADRRKDRFLATLAHELRNPLAPLSNALQAWPYVKDDAAEMGRLRETMDRQVRQMSRLIDDLLDVSRITRGKLVLRKEQTDVKSVLDAAVEEVRPLIAAKGQRLTVSVSDPTPALEGDVTRLVQVFSNLLRNAAKYTDDGGRIDVQGRPRDGRLIVSVTDDGVGISAEMLVRVFDLFAQADQTLDRSHGGLGIGLTLVKTLVELHGGSVEAHSDGPGRGSRFVVVLPLAAGQATAQPVRSAEPAPSRARGTHRILVVDDMRPSARTLSLLLQGIGQETCLAHDGPAALSALDNFDADVVLLDIAMPGMDGYEVARRIRARGTGQPLLVALTGYGGEEDRKQAFDAGFDRHLVKPVGLDALKELLAGVGTRYVNGNGTFGPGVGTPFGAETTGN